MAPPRSFIRGEMVGLYLILVLLVPTLAQDLDGLDGSPLDPAAPPTSPPLAGEVPTGAPTPGPLGAPPPLAPSSGPAPNGVPPAVPPTADPALAPPVTSRAPSPVDATPPADLDTSQPPPEEFPPPALGTSELRIRWCTTSATEETFCNNALADLHSLSAPQNEWSCIIKEDPIACMAAIRAKEADLMVVEAGLAFVAFFNYSMKAIMGETYTGGAVAPGSYKAVALVRASLCQEKKFKLASLKGKTSCHSGYKTAAGWDLPLRKLVELELQKPANRSPLPDDIEMISSFFGKSCSVGNTNNNSICSGCPGEGGCDAAFAGDIGALRCLANGGDVAFVRNELLPPFQCHGARNKDCSIPGLENLHLTDYRLLCPLGGCADPDTYQENCVLGTVPGNAVMVRNQADPLLIAEIISVLERAKPENTKLFSSTKVADELFSAMAVGVARLPESMLTRQYLGDAGWAAQNVSNWATGNVFAGATALRANGLCLLSGVLSVLISLLALR
eukprot:TRINITY_DN20795_c0_g1_i1.p1 TRINITY_DN20795_c0_g1~~TRINITY_DN20795_c0_g1_i1.p1  ORF type:complete len:504 (-),score=73.81 TRINITY_DN20795_c0_g1_i1:795-2306(-)